MAYNFISNPTNLTKLVNRFKAQKEAGIIIVPAKKFTPEELTWDYWIKAAEYCIDCSVAMDEVDYDNSPKEVKACWKGLKDKDPMMENVY